MTNPTNAAAKHLRILLALGCLLATLPITVAATPGAEGTELEEVTYTRHVAPLLAANCVECHRQGGIAPFSLEGYDDAKRWHRMVAYMTGERLMPPWRAVPGFGEFRDARRLSDHQIALLAAWSENGARRGDAGDVIPAPLRPESKWRLGKPDLVLRMPEPFDVPADGEDIYRYFVIPSGFTEDKVVTALEFSPGDPKVVHRANYLMDYGARARAEDAKDEEAGFSVFGTGGFLDYNAWGIGGWTPGPIPMSSTRDWACGCPRTETSFWRCTTT